MRVLNVEAVEELDDRFEIPTILRMAQTDLPVYDRLLSTVPYWRSEVLPIRTPTV